MVSYYAYIDAMYNYAKNEYAKKIIEKFGYSSGRFGIRSKSQKIG